VTPSMVPTRLTNRRNARSCLRKRHHHDHAAPGERVPKPRCPVRMSVLVQLQGSGKPRMPTLAEMRADCTAYLIELHDEEDLTALEQVERDYVFFFKRELELWEGTDETH